jgi:hypothetical protein
MREYTAVSTFDLLQQQMPQHEPFASNHRFACADQLQCQSHEEARLTRRICLGALSSVKMTDISSPNSEVMVSAMRLMLRPLSVSISLFSSMRSSHGDMRSMSAKSVSGMSKYWVTNSLSSSITVSCAHSQSAVLLSNTDCGRHRILLCCCVQQWNVDTMKGY